MHETKLFIMNLFKIYKFYFIWKTFKVIVDRKEVGSLALEFYFFTGLIYRKYVIILSPLSLWALDFKW